MASMTPTYRELKMGRRGNCWLWPLRSGMESKSNWLSMRMTIHRKSLKSSALNTTLTRIFKTSSACTLRNQSMKRSLKCWRKTSLKVLILMLLCRMKMRFILMKFCIQRTKLRLFKKKILRMRRPRIEKVLNKQKIRKMNLMSRSRKSSTTSLEESQDLSISYSNLRLMRNHEKLQKEFLKELLTRDFITRQKTVFMRRSFKN